MKAEKQHATESREHKNITNFNQWYGAHRCHGSPKNPNRVLNLAFRIWEEDFPHAIEPDDLENEVIETLRGCFARFEPARGNPEVAVDDRFIGFFRSCFVRRLKDRARDEASRGRRKATLRYYHLKRAYEQPSRGACVLEDWRWFLYKQALRRLSLEAQRYIRLHFVQDKTVDEIARIMKVSKSTLCRKYGKDRLVSIIQNEVNMMVMSIPRENLEELVYTLYVENDLEVLEIARLFCVAPTFIREVIGSVSGRIMRGLELEAGKRLFDEQ